jgi:DNA uptake protein ComE-like DNA-binding protein
VGRKQKPCKKGKKMSTGSTAPPVTLAQLQAYLASVKTVTADEAQLTTDQGTEATAATTVAAGLSSPTAALSADNTTIYLFTPTPSGSFTVTPYPFAGTLTS